MRLLLDTHVALWSVAQSDRLPKFIRDMIADEANEIVVSAASIWEIAIKHSLTRPSGDPMPISADEAISIFGLAGFTLLPVSPEHAAAVERLSAHHGDPFDRLLVAQAMTEPLRLVSRDPAIARYGEMVISF